MIAEFIIHRMGWTDVWYAHPGPWTIQRWIAHRFGFGGCWYVGVWTGPERDLICVKPCDSNLEANLYLSPGGWTITHAALRAWWKLWRMS